LRGRLQRTQDLGGQRQVYHLQRPDGLVQLLPCNPQLAGIERLEI
jgi:hypothetical protein